MHTQMKWMLEGTRIDPQPDGRILITDAKYRTLRETGEGDMAVQAPQCFYDRDQRSINSSGPIHVQTADGRFSIEGEGFLYQQTNSTLQVSNRVHTIIQAGLLSPQPATNRSNKPVEAAPAMDIFSDKFEYVENPSSILRGAFTRETFGWPGRIWPRPPSG